VLRASLHDGAQEVDENREPLGGHYDVADRDVTMSGTVLMKIGQRRAQNIQKSRQMGVVEPSARPENHVQPGSVDEVRDDARPVLGQGHHLPHGRQAGVTQDAQIGQPP